MKLFLAGLILLGIPGYYLIRFLHKKKIKKRKHLELGIAYDRLVKETRFSIEHSELLNGKVIALDRKNKKLLVVDHTRIEKQEECISLLGIESCRIIEVKHNPCTCIGKILLEFRHKHCNKIISFCFYDDTNDLKTELPALSKMAKFWKHRIDLHKYPGSVGLQLEYVL